MKLEHQVVSLELAQKLKELGVPQESLFYWHEKSGNVDFYNHFMPSDRDFSAYTVAELGEIFRRLLHKGIHVGTFYDVALYQFRCTVFLCDAEDLGPHHETRDTIEANCRAKMLIWLIETKSEKTLVDPKTLSV